MQSRSRAKADDVGGRLPRRAASGISLAVVVVLSALASTGCPPPAVYQTADTLAPGAWQVGGGLGAVGFRDTEQDTRVPGLDVEVFARRGIQPGIDAGLRLYSMGLEGSVKWRVQEGTWSLAVMPGLSLLRSKESALTTNAWHSFATLPLLASRRLSPRWSVSLGPRAMTGLYKSTASDLELGAGLGGYALFALHLGSYRLMPELDLTRVVLGNVPVHGWVSHFGLGLSWSR